MKLPYEGKVLLEWEQSFSGKGLKHLSILTILAYLFFIFSITASLLNLYRISSFLEDYSWLIGGLAIALLLIPILLFKFKQKIKVVITNEGVGVYDFPWKTFKKWEKFDSYKIIKQAEILRINFKSRWYTPFTIPLKEENFGNAEKIISKYLRHES